MVENPSFDRTEHTLRDGPRMSATPERTVALVDPLWVGHHPMYFSQFSASFLRCGARVIGLCPEPEMAKAAFQAAEPELAAAGRITFHKLAAGKRSFFQGRFEGDPVRTFTRWRHAAEALAEAEIATGWHADLVYFPYLDSYLRFLPLDFVPWLLLGRPWSGLYLRNHHYGEPASLKKSLRMLAKGDALLQSGLCRGIGVLDERFIPAMKAKTGMAVTAYPDVTQTDLPQVPYPLATEIRRKAAGRKIVGIIGLERRKGFLTLLRTAALARAARLPFYFVCGGIYPPGEFSEDELAEIGKTVDGISSGEIDNLHFDPQATRIPSEADYNSLFHTFDIAWAAYEGFQGSSGALGKAAAFEIPCLATAGECIGDRVERYRLGLTIPEGNATSALAALRQLADRRDWMCDPLDSLFAAYRQRHSQTELDRILAALLNADGACAAAGKRA